MGCCKYVLVVLVAVVAWGSYHVSEIPVPQDFENPWLLRMMFSTIKLSKLYMHLKENFYEYEDMLIANHRIAVKEPPIDSLGVEVTDTMIEHIPVSFYTPDGLPAQGNPGIAIYHSGGWVHDSPGHHAYCQQLAKEVQAIVMAVEYRLAPVHPYPAPINDCVQATKTFIENAENFGVDPLRIAVAGDSEGGNLAAAVALRLRDINFKPQPKLQVLMHPALQAIDFYTPSFQEYENDPILSKREMVRYWHLYATGDLEYLDDCMVNEHTAPHIKSQTSQKQLNHDIILRDYKSSKYIKDDDVNFGNARTWIDIKKIFTDPYFAPLMAQNVSDLPEMLMVTVEQDVLRDDGVWYAKYLRDAGVTVHHHHYQAGFHGLMSFVIDQTNNREVMEIVYDGIRKIL